MYYRNGVNHDEFNVIVDGNVDHWAFYKWEHIDRIFLSSKKIGLWAFAFTKRAIQLELKNTTYIGCNAFYKCGVEKVIIPGSVKYIGSYAFANMPNLKYVEFRGLIPPEMGNEVFRGYEGEIIVPLASVGNYKLERIRGKIWLKHKSIM